MRTYKLHKIGEKAILSIGKLIATTVIKQAVDKAENQKILDYWCKKHNIDNWNKKFCSKADKAVFGKY